MQKGTTLVVPFSFTSAFISAEVDSVAADSAVVYWAEPAGSAAVALSPAPVAIVTVSATAQE